MDKEKPMVKKVGLLILAVLLVSVSLFSSDEEIAKKYKLTIRESKGKDTLSIMPKKAGGRSTIFLYIVKRLDNNNYHLRLRLAYFGKAQLFMKRYLFTVDGKEHDLNVRQPLQILNLSAQNVPGKYHDGKGTGICEFYDIALNPQEMELMKKLATAKKVLIRYDGTRGYKNAKIFKSELKDMRRVLDAFKELNPNP